MGQTPKFYVQYAVEADREQVAPYEDCPVHVMVQRHIAMLGGRIVIDAEAADFILAVNTPTRLNGEFDPKARGLEAEVVRRAPHLDAFTAQIADWLAEDRHVILCDVAYRNGSDPALIERILSWADLPKLAAYGAWNTAGNTIGMALAQGIAAWMGATPEATAAQQEAQHRFLLQRFIEDWAYQHVLRERIRDWLEAETGLRDTAPQNETETVRRIHDRLNTLVPRLGALSDGWRIDAVTLPWRRTYEIDMVLTYEQDDPDDDD